MEPFVHLRKAMLVAYPTVMLVLIIASCAMRELHAAICGMVMFFASVPIILLSTGPKMPERAFEFYQSMAVASIIGAPFFLIWVFKMFKEHERERR